MSTRGDIQDWCVTRLTSQVTTLRSVKALASIEEFRGLVRNLPAAGVVITDDADSGENAPPGEQFIHLSIHVIVAARRFRADTGAGLSDDDGVYELLDSIWDAFKEQTPTSADHELFYRGSSLISTLEDLANGLLLWDAEYMTGTQLS